MPDNWVYVRLNDINDYKSKSINPASFAEEVFESYSVPIYESGHPEMISGKEIGSSKQLVKSDDILLCKINPKINRVWIVGDYRGHQQIASSEWIVVRNKLLDVEYLRYYFLSPNFRDKMVSNVTGVGGSLTRAQPSLVKTYLIALPPINEQKRVVEAISRFMKLIDSIAENL